MKKLNQIREDYDMITEKEENEERKLVALVRAGLFDAKKLPALKKALDKTADKMTAQEKRMLLNLLDELMSQVITNQPVYQKVKQNLMKEEKKEYPVDQTIPSVILLKRKAIRTFPNGQKVALYYAQSIDKYVSIPYNEVGLSEEIELDEAAGAIVRGIAAIGGKALGAARSYIGKKVAEKGAAAGKAIEKYKAGRTLAKADKAARLAKREKAIDKLKTIRSKNKNAFKGKKGGKGGKLAAGAAGVAGGLSAASSGGSGGGSEPKYFTPMSQARHGGQDLRSAPQRVGGSQDAYQKRIEIANRKASETMSRQTNESVSLNLDGNIFELNNIASRKVTSLYESLNKKNKKKMIEMMKESNDSLEKVISFAVRQ